LLILIFSKNERSFKMSVSYAIRSEVNAQVVIWAICGALYQMAKGAQRVAACLLACLPALWVALQVVTKASVLVAVIVGCVVGAVMYPAIVVGVFGVWCALMVSKPK
jgi:Flp pilus assembly protein TadB